MDEDGQQSALFACIAELFQHLDTEVILILLAAEVDAKNVELSHIVI